MDRERLFPAGEPARLSGLANLTAPSASENVAAIVDVAVVGARSDGKTQFILHAIRTLGADVPDDLPESERGPTLDIMQVVLAAESPRPDANNPDAGVPHYVFRLSPRKLLEQVGFGARLVLLGLGRTLGVTIAIAALIAAVSAFAGVLDAVFALALVWLAATIAGVAFLIGRARFLRRGPVEVVFWDVAGENLYGSRQKSADYWSLLKHLVRRRQQDARAERPYGFAPVLICNPLTLGADANDSPFGRLRPLLPIFSSLSKGSPEALVVINRWEAVRGVCPPGGDREEHVAIVSEARAVAGRPVVVAPTEPLPVVRRGTVRECCVDLEETREEGVHLQVLRYDAGMCDVTSAPWKSFDELEEPVRARWLAPTLVPNEVVTYRFTEGPRAFEDEARRVFLRWLARLAFRSSTRAGMPAEPTSQSVPVPAQTLQMFAADEKASGFRSGGN